MVRMGRVSYIPHQRFLSDNEAFEVAVAFRRDHPHRLRLFGRVLGWDELSDDNTVRALVRTHPFVALRPSPPSSGSALTAPAAAAL